jgi:hypothetical protein
MSTRRHHSLCLTKNWIRDASFVCSWGVKLSQTITFNETMVFLHPVCRIEPKLQTPVLLNLLQGSQTFEVSSINCHFNILEMCCNLLLLNEACVEFVLSCADLFPIMCRLCWRGFCEYSWYAYKSGHVTKRKTFFIRFVWLYKIHWLQYSKNVFVILGVFCGSRILWATHSGLPSVPRDSVLYIYCSICNLTEWCNTPSRPSLPTMNFNVKHWDSRLSPDLESVPGSRAFSDTSKYTILCCSKWL